MAFWFGLYLPRFFESAGGEVPFADESGLVSGIFKYVGDAALVGIGFDPVQDQAGMGGIAAGLEHASERGTERAGWRWRG